MSQAESLRPKEKSGTPSHVSVQLSNPHPPFASEGALPIRPDKSIRSFTRGRSQSGRLSGALNLWHETVVKPKGRSHITKDIVNCKEPTSKRAGKRMMRKNKGVKRIKRRFKQIFAGNDSCTTHRLNEGNM